MGAVQYRGGPKDGRYEAYDDDGIPKPIVEVERENPEQPMGRDPDLPPVMQKGRYRRRQVFVYEWAGWQ